MTTEDKNTKNKNAKNAAAHAEQSAASHASEARDSGRNAKEKAQEAKKSTVFSTQAAGEATQRVGRAASAGLQSGQHVVAANASKAVAAAGTAWSVVKNRKVIAAGAAAGAVSVTGAAFVLGRSTARAQMGPLTKLTGGRI